MLLYGSWGTKTGIVLYEATGPEANDWVQVADIRESRVLSLGCTDDIDFDADTLVTTGTSAVFRKRVFLYDLPPVASPFPTGLPTPSPSPLPTLS